MTDTAVPFLDLVTPHRELEEELVVCFREALRSAHFIGGPQVEGFEREFADYCSTKHAIGVANGTDAVRFALMASGIGAGDAVVTVAHTFIATVEAISQAGAAAEFVDVDEHTYNMSPEALSKYLAGCQKDSATGRPIGRRSGKPIKAIVPVHLYGQVADMDRIAAIAEQYGLLIVEDACQAHGAEYLSAGTWKRAGTFGRAAAFSFYPGKNLGACGEAGAVTTNDDGVARTIRMLREHGQVQKYYHDIEGYNGRLDAIQAAFLRVKLQRLDSWNAQRRTAAAKYNQLFTAINAASAGVVAPFEPQNSRGVYHLYVVRSKDRDALAASLKAENIHTGFHYPVPLHLQKAYLGWGYAAGSLPVTERVAHEIISLPMFPGLTSEQQERVVAAVHAFAAAAAAR